MLGWRSRPSRDNSSVFNIRLYSWAVLAQTQCLYLCRPLVLGRRSHPSGDEYCVASEDCAFGPIGFERVRDVEPGEMIVISPEGHLRSFQCAEGQCCPCIFEYIYLSRPDTVLNDISVYLFQLGLGTRLAKRIRCALTFCLCMPPDFPFCGCGCLFKRLCERERGSQYEYFYLSPFLLNLWCFHG